MEKRENILTSVSKQTGKKSH